MLSRELLGCQMSSRCACLHHWSSFCGGGARVGVGLRLASACVLKRSPVARAGRMYIVYPSRGPDRAVRVFFPHGAPPGRPAPAPGRPRASGNRKRRDPYRRRVKTVVRRRGRLRYLSAPAPRRAVSGLGVSPLPLRPLFNIEHGLFAVLRFPFSVLFAHRGCRIAPAAAGPAARPPLSSKALCGYLLRRSYALPT
jgi:hypothetical protein